MIESCTGNTKESGYPPTTWPRCVVLDELMNNKTVPTSRLVYCPRLTPLLFYFPLTFFLPKHSLDLRYFSCDVHDIITSGNPTSGWAISIRTEKQWGYGSAKWANKHYTLVDKPDYEIWYEEVEQTELRKQVRHQGYKVPSDTCKDEGRG